MNNTKENRAEPPVHEQYNLYLEENGEHGLYIHSEDAFDENSMMYRAYYAAFSALRSILNDMKRCGKVKYRFHEEPDYFPRKPSPEYGKGFDYERASNIIAFCGARGQGKTSAMLSFADTLIDDRLRARFWNGKDDNDKLPAIEYVYAPPPVDLTLLERGDTLLEIILSNFLHTLKDAQSRESGDEKRQRELNDLYRSIKDCLNKVRTRSGDGRKDDKSQGKGRKDKVTLDDLFDLEVGVDFAMDLSRLIRDFFDFLRGNSKNSYLLIRLDDTDLQFERSYDILEEARKYLSLPNVIVLMATDLNQLRLCVMKRFNEELKYAFDDEKKKWEYVQEAAAKYLDKLIPSTHAIYLPTIRSFYDTGKTINLYRLEENKEKPIALGELQDYLLSAIFEKTGVAFLKRYKSGDYRHRKGHIHHIIPTTLRGLTHLVRLLERMPAPHAKPRLSTLNGATRDEWESAWKAYCEGFLAWARDIQKNLRKFEDYFLNDWCSSRLRGADWDIIRDIRGDAVPEKALRHMIFILEGDASKKDGASKEGAPSVGGDYIRLNYLLNRREENEFSRKTYSFGFAVRTYFSLLFHKIALQEQIDSLTNELERMEQPDRDGNYPLFSFRYTRLQDFLQPRLFDAVKIQKDLLKNLDILTLRSEPLGICFTIDEELRADFYDKQSRYILKKSGETLDIPVYVFVSGNAGFDTFSKEIFWYVDLLNYFYKGLSFFYPEEQETVYSAEQEKPLLKSKRKKRKQEKQEEQLRKEKEKREEQLRILRMQNLAVFVCCNWDVQERIQMSLTGALDNTFSLWMRVKKIGKGDTNIPPLQIKKSDLALYMDAIYQHIFTYLQDRCSFRSTEFEDMNDAEPDNEGNIAFVRDYIPDFLPSISLKSDYKGQLDVMSSLFDLMHDSFDDFDSDHILNMMIPMDEEE